MTKRHSYITLVLLACIVLAAAACTQQRQPCLTPKIASLLVQTAHFTTDTSTTTADTALPHAVLAPLPASGTLRGTVYTQQSLFSLSLSPDSTVCQWVFTTDSLKHPIDTLTFFYRRQLNFLSNACGYTYFYGLDSVHTTHFNIDSLQILNTSVTTNVNTKHLKVYIHPGF